MTRLSFTLSHPADLYLGTSRETARAEGHRHFTSAASAIRFAMEQAAPVSLRGALLVVGDRWLTGNDIRAIYQSNPAFGRRVVTNDVGLLESA